MSLLPAGTSETISPMKEPIPAPRAAGNGPAVIAKKAGITTPGRNSPKPKGVEIKLVAALTIAYNAAQIAADATSLALLLVDQDLYITLRGVRDIY